MKRNNTKILLIEDDPVCMKAQKNILESVGLQVDFAITGMDGLNLKHEADLEELLPHYALIFVDINLPDISGDNIAKIIQQSKSKSLDIPIIAITGYASETEKKTHLSKGFDYVIQKPLTKEKVQAIIKSCCTH